MAKVTADKLGRFRPQTRNSNRHTQRGMGQLEASMRKYGYVTPMTAAADGEIIDGSARAETGATVFGDDMLVVHHDGTKPVIMVRDDIPSADTPEAREISIAANRIAQVNLDFDPEVLLGDLQAGVDLSGLWFEHELDNLLGAFADDGEIDPAQEWRGMPEFEHDDLTSFHSVHVHFANIEALNAFAELVGQKLTDKTRSMWYPKQEIIRYGEVRES